MRIRITYDLVAWKLGSFIAREQHRRVLGVRIKGDFVVKAF